MTEQQYLDLSGLILYDEKIKAHIDSKVSDKADSDHNHDDKYASKEEFGLLEEQVDGISTDGLMTVENPVGTGSISMNRKADTAIGENSVALGTNCSATGHSSVAMGNACKAGGNCGVAIGNNCEAQSYAIAIGHYTKANYNYALSFGIENIAQNWNSCAIGGYNKSQGRSSFVTGYCNIGNGDYQTVSGKYNVEDNQNKYAHIVGNGTSNSSGDRRSNAYTLDWQGNGWFAGDVTATDADGNSVSLLTVAANAGSGDYLSQNSPVGIGSFSMNRKADTEIGSCSVTLGSNCTASGDWSYAEGCETIASSLDCHAEGYQTVSSGGHSHSEGYGSVASGQFSHAQNDSTVASGQGSHSEGCGTIAASLAQHAQGAFNIEDTANTYLHIVGNGESGLSRSNAHTLDWDGNAWYAGDVTSTDSNGNSISLNSLAVAIDDITPIDISDIEGLFA